MPHIVQPWLKCSSSLSVDSATEVSHGDPPEPPSERRVKD